MSSNDDGFTRLKKNQLTRQLLSSSNVDLNFVSVQNTSKSLNLSGKLVKVNRQPFTPEELFLLLEKLKRISRNITTDLENWDLNGWQVIKIEKQNVNKFFKPIKNKKKKRKKFIEEEEVEDIIIDLS